ncbi:MAG: hypothetical protein WCE68_09660 [Anaerolineales bacterium]
MLLLAACAAGQNTITSAKTATLPVQPSAAMTMQPVNTVTSEITSTPRFRPVCGAPVGDDFASQDGFGDGFIARVPIQAVANKGQQDIVYNLVNQWLAHYQTNSRSASAAIKRYTINDIKLRNPFCDPFFLILSSVDFSIVPAQIPNEFASFPSASTKPNDTWVHIFVPFAVFKDGNDYRLRMVFGWGT